VVPLARSGEPPFRGHITLARAKRGLDTSVRARLAGIGVTASFLVDAFDVVHSELSGQGPQYTTLERIVITG
jgi:2'-5' RNA ligase